jgi:two-component system, OmpR family, sensor histidine kinase SaeS
METTQRRTLPPRVQARVQPRPAGIRRIRLGVRWLGVTLLALALALAAAVLMLHPPMGHIQQLVAYLAFSGVVALGLGELALWLTNIPRLRGVRFKLAIPPVLAALVIGITVVTLAQGMFISFEDSELLLIFLAFAVVVALALAGSLAGELGGAIEGVERGARRIAAGDYGFRVAEDEAGAAEELRELARWFNEMAANVQQAFAERQVAEADRRQVVAAVSHDLRTPLASVRALIEAVDDGVVSDPETVRRYQRTIRAELARLSVLLDELFDLSRLDAGALQLERERLGIEDLLSDALEAFSGRAERAGVRLEGRAEGDLPTLSLDPRQISRTLANLLENALRHTPRGGAILLRALPNPADEGGGVIVQVIDGGEGIPSGDLPHIFERTYRGEAARSRQQSGGTGAGLGLAIARGIIEMHGGRIWAVSPLPAGLRTLLRNDAGAPSSPGAVLCFTIPTSAID